MINKKIASIKLNAIGNYFGQSYTILVTLLCTPLYIKYLGAESYGLVGFFIIVQKKSPDKSGLIVFKVYRLLQVPLILSNV